MSKIKSAFFCQHCGYESVKWVGQCPSCGQWNTFVEELIQKETIKNGNGWKEYNNDTRINKTISLIEITSSEDERLSTADAELNRVLGGGIVPGSIILVAGEPGIGKSTLFLQNGLQLKNIITLYISGEESEQQIKMRSRLVSHEVIEPVNRREQKENETQYNPRRNLRGHLSRKQPDYRQD